MISFNPFRRSRLIRNGISRACTISVDASLPTETDIVIVGGGIAGITCAIHLADHGQRVTVCEKGHIAGEQSSRAFGWVSSLLDEKDRLSLSLEGKQLWETYERKFEVDLTFRRNGALFLSYSEEQISEFKRWIEEARHVGHVDAKILYGEKLFKYLPEARDTGAIAGLYQASDGCVEPIVAVPLLANAARRAGVTILEQCAVQGIETSGGNVSHIITEQGTIRAPVVVVAGGIWSRLFMRFIGVSLPQLPVYGSLCRTAPMACNLPGTGSTGTFGWRRHIDGSYSFGQNKVTHSVIPDSFSLLRHFLPSFSASRDSVSLDFDRDFLDHTFASWKRSTDGQSPFERARTLIGRPDMSQIDEVIHDLRNTFPSFADVKIVESWGGVIDVTPDRLPIISAIDAINGLYACTGFSAHGLVMAPAAGKLLAESIVGKIGAHALDPYSIKRFSRA